MRLSSLVLTLPLLLALAGCTKGAPSTTETWTRAYEGASKSADRVRVIEQLRDSGQANPAMLPTLHGWLAKEARTPVKSSIAGLLGTLEDPSSVEPLAAAIEKTPDADGKRLNRAIATALTRIGHASAGPALIALLEPKDPYTRIAAVEGLGALKVTAAAPQLEKLAEDLEEEPFLSKKAIEALGEIGAPSSVPVLVRMMFQERPGISFYPDSAFALYRLGDQATPALLRVLKGEDAELLKWAREHRVREAGILAKTAQVLGDLQVAEAEPLLLKHLSYEAALPELQLIVRMFSAEALGRMGARNAAAPIAALLVEPEPSARLQYLRALTQLGGKEGIPGLVTATSGEFWELREAGARGLSLLGGEAELAAFGPLLEQEAARTTAGCEQAPDEPGCSDPAALAKQRLATLQRHRATLASSVGVQGPDAWTAKLTATEPGLRERAVLELGRTREGSAIAAVAPLTADPDLEVRAAATYSLQLLTQTPEARKRAAASLDAWKKQLEREQGQTRLARSNEDLRRLVVKVAR